MNRLRLDASRRSDGRSPAQFRQLLLRGLPALLAGVLLLAGALILCIPPSGSQPWSYDRLTRQLLAQKQFKPAWVAGMRGLAGASSERERLQWIFYLAMAQSGQGRPQAAGPLLALAAPEDHPGCAQAHVTVAQSLLSATNLTPEILRRAEHHLLNAVAAEPQSLEGNEMLGRYYINTHNPAKARKYLRQVYSARPEVALLLAISCAQDHDEINAVLWADRAIGVCERNLMQSAPKYDPADRLGLVQALSIKQMYAPQPEMAALVAKSGTNAAPQDSPSFWFGMVRLLMAKGKFGPALETLEQQMASHSNALYSAAIAEVCAVWAQNIPVGKPGGYATRLQLIQKGLAYQPRQVGLQLMLVQTTHAPDASAAAAQQMLDDALAGATGEVAAWWHFVLWTDARVRGDLPTARQHLQTAYQMAPQIPEIENDLAMDLSSGSREDWERGLKLIGGLAEKYPNYPGFRDTRGQILAKLGRYDEAIADLEYALPRLGYPVASRQVLKECYAAMGRIAPAPEAQLAAVLGQVRSLASEQKYDEALAKLEKAMHENPTRACAAAIADFCVTCAHQTPAGQFDKRLQLIQKGLGYVPEQSGLKQILLQMANGGGASGVAARKLMNQLVAGASGDAAADWHLCLGEDARRQGDLAAARLQLETAYETDPVRKETKAQLAAILVDGDQADWEKGLRLIESVLSEAPNDLESRNTRGLLLAKLGQNKSAAADLAAAAAGLAQPAETRLALARVYDALGKPQLAEQQRRLAASAAKP